MRTPVLCAAAVAAGLSIASDARAGAPVLVTVPAALDNTLYEDANGSISNAQGPGLFSGKTRFAGVRRALVEFDLSAIPANATIVSATMTLHLTRAISAGNQQSLHRVLASWGEGASTTGPDESLNAGGGGDTATTGDATWVHRFFNTTAWTTPGGDFAPAASATTTVDDIQGPYSWSGAGLVADVQSWLVNPSSNHGWIVLGVESGFANAKRFASSENADASLRPALKVTYTVPVPCLGDLNNDGQRNTLDLTQFLSNFGSVVAPGTNGDLDGSGTVTTADLVLFLGVFGVPC